MRIAFRLAALVSMAALAACASDPAPAVSAPAAEVGPQVASLPRGADATPSIDPERLKGMRAADVKAALGTPVFSRRDAPAEIWQYRAKACTLDLFLYDEGGTPVVTYFTVRAPRPIADKACLDELAQARRAVPGS